MSSVFLILTLLSIIILFSCEEEPTSPKINTYSIHGKVTGRNDNPFKSVEIQVIGIDINKEGITDKNGLYRISGFPNGVYRISFYYEGFILFDTGGKEVRVDIEILNSDIIVNQHFLRDI